MLLLDANVLLYAHQVESPAHRRYAKWIERLVASGEPFAIPSTVLAAFLRIATNAGVFTPPVTLDAGLRYLRAFRDHPGWRLAEPGPRHWELFERCCRETAAAPGLVGDAYLAALAMEHDGELVTSDADFRRFAGLRWRHPLA